MIIRLAVNYSDATAELLRRGHVDFDYFKTPAWTDLIATAQTLHPVNVHFPLLVGCGIGGARDGETGQPPDWGKIEALLAQTGTPLVNVHMVAPPDAYPDVPLDSDDPAHVERVTGPLIVVSNHPGAYDSVAILASLPPRADQMIVASDVPFLRRVPAIGARTIYVSPDPHARMGVIRAMIRHLETGGALMTFGSGLVDPDPDLLPGAAEALETWYDSLAIVLRRVPETRLVLSIVSSVVAPQYMRSPLTRLKQDGWERRKLAEFLQIGSQLMFSKKATVTQRVSFSRLMRAADIPAEPGQPITMRPIIERAKALLAEHMNYRHCEGGSPKQSQASG